MAGSYGVRAINGIIYCIRHADSGKSYIGQTIGNVEKRWKVHLYCAYEKDSHYPLYNAMRHYDVVGNFKFGIIKHGISSQDELDALEIQYIKDRNTLVPNG